MVHGRTEWFAAIPGVGVLFILCGLRGKYSETRDCLFAEIIAHIVAVCRGRLPRRVVVVQNSVAHDLSQSKAPQEYCSMAFTSEPHKRQTNKKETFEIRQTLESKEFLA